MNKNSKIRFVRGNVIEENSNKFKTNVDSNFYRYVGYDESTDCMSDLFSEKNLNSMSNEITKRLKGVDKNGRDIVVPLRTIGGVLSSVYLDGRDKSIGDVFTRYNIINNDVDRLAQILILQTIQIIVDQIRNEYEMKDNNEKMSVWNSILGDYNENGLRQHSPIKIRQNHPQYMMFNMNY